MFKAPLHQRVRLQHLRLLVGIADGGSLQAAAQQLHISQPAATKALRQLESALGHTLVERSPGGSRLTPVGDLLCRRARLILSELSDVDDEIGRWHSGHIGRVSVGAMPVATSHLLPLAIERLMQTQSGIQVQVTEASSDLLFPHLKEGRFDLLLGRFWPGNDPDLVNDVLYESRFMLAVRPAHPMLTSRRLKLARLMDYPWILPPPGAHSRLALEDMFRHARLGLPPHPLETTSYPVMRALLERTDAICPMPIETLQRDVDIGLIALLPLRLDLHLPPVGIVRVRNRTSSRACEIFMQHLRQSVCQMVG